MSQLVTSSEPEAIFSPDWADNHSPFSGVAYAIYQFEVSGWEGQPVLHIKWTMAPKDPGLVWLGFSNWERDRWDWFAYPATGIALGAAGLDRYKDQASRETLVAVVVLGQGASSLLQRVWFTDSSARGDWWMQGRDAQHTSCSRFVGPDSPQEQWRFDAGTWSNNVFSDGSSYYENRMPVIFDYDNTCYFVVAQSETEHLSHALHAVAPGGEVVWVASSYFHPDTTKWHSLALGDD